MNSNLKLAPRTFPARIAELGFTANLPSDWISHELPNEALDFSNPTLPVPLAIVTAPHARLSSPSPRARLTTMGQFTIGRCIC